MRLDSCIPWILGRTGSQFRYTLPLLGLFALGCYQSPETQPGQIAQEVTTKRVALSKSTGPVGDFADIFASKDEVVLNARAKAFFNRTQTAFVIVTTSTLEGQEIGSFATELGRRWEVGGSRGGLLAVIAPNERQVFIATTDDVRARLSDGDLNKIIDREIIPRFREQAYFAGMDAGMDAIELHLSRGS